MNHLRENIKSRSEQMIEACKRSGALGYGAGSGGNASYRVDDNVVLITPTGIVKRKYHLSPSRISVSLIWMPILFAFRKTRKPAGEYSHASAYL